MKSKITNFDPLKLDNQLCFPFYAASRLITQAYSPLLEKLNLTYPQYVVLLILWENNGLSVKAISQKMIIDSGTLTPILKKMETAGLIQRSRDKRDDRNVLNYCTKKSLLLRPKALQIMEKVFCQSQLRIDEVILLKEKLNFILTTLSH